MKLHETDRSRVLDQPAKKLATNPVVPKLLDDERVGDVAPGTRGYAGNGHGVHSSQIHATDQSGAALGNDDMPLSRFQRVVNPSQKARLERIERFEIALVFRSRHPAKQGQLLPIGCASTPNGGSRHAAPRADEIQPAVAGTMLAEEAAMVIAIHDAEECFEACNLWIVLVAVPLQVSID